MHDAVENGVCRRCVWKPAVPGIERQLTRNARSSCLIAIVEDFQEIPTFVRRERMLRKDFSNGRQLFPVRDKPHL